MSNVFVLPVNPPSIRLLLIVAVEPVKPTRVQNQFFKKDQGKTPKKVPALPSPSDKKDEINKKRVPWDKTTVKVIVNPYASPRMVNKK